MQLTLYKSSLDWTGILWSHNRYLHVIDRLSFESTCASINYREQPVWGTWCQGFWCPVSIGLCSRDEAINREREKTTQLQPSKKCELIVQLGIVRLQCSRTCLCKIKTKSMRHLFCKGTLSIDDKVLVGDDDVVERDDTRSSPPGVRTHLGHVQ